ncbi:MAG: hypothetical protein HOP31_06530 [Ignavibacteria bacterium]|nr:hypothetical protein [Ignavibacteria bacterium]
MKSNSSIIAAYAVYVFFAAAILIASIQINDGHFVYALDDTYIHMSIADNLTTSGNFATNKIHFASASSSPMWVLIISSVYLAAGKNLMTPFIVNFLFQLLSITVLNFAIKKSGVTKYTLLYMLALILITPFPAVLFAGMEHSVQIFFTLVFVFFSLNLVSSGKKLTKFDLPVILISSFFFGGIRYEDLILVFIVCMLLFLSGRRLFSLGVLTSGALPMLAYGLFSTSHGGMFFPNTLLLKSSLPALNAEGIVRFISKAFSNITEPHILVMLAVLTLLYMINFNKGLKFRDIKQLLLFVTAISLIINMCIIEYNHNGSFYRYEAYLIALGILAVSLSIHGITNNIKNYFSAINSKFVKASVFLLMFVVLSPLFVRMLTAAGILHASMEYYKQQYQMAQFCKSYAGDMTIALNDIGMVNYYTENKIFDLLGLADIDVAKHRLNGTYNTSVIESLGKKENVKLVMCYGDWFDEYGGLPASWKKIAGWTMTDRNLYLGNSTVDIYVTDPADENYIREKLIEYSGRLPKSVIFELKN